MRHFKSKRSVKLSIALASFILMPLWIFFVAPFFTKLSADFSYQVDMISLDDFYDPDEGEFTGENLSVTHFSYEVVEVEGGILTIRNVFDVRTLDGEGIYAGEEFFGIDAKTGAHVIGHGDRDREGYLFAPRNLRKGESFIHWRVGNDLPAHMQYMDEEILFGLPVYRYETDYDGQHIDHTESRSDSPEKGVRLEPYMTLWVEPVTGWVVQAHDEAVNYYYDIETGEPLEPLNSFSNEYQSSSVIQQVKTAKQMKFIFKLVEVMIPARLGLIGVSLLISLKKKPLAIRVFGTGFVVLSLYFCCLLHSLPSEDVIKIGIARWVPEGNSQYDYNIKGFKDALSQAGYVEGENVEYYLGSASAEPESQRQIIQSFLDQEVDMIYSLTTTGTLIVKEEVSDIPVIFSIVTYPVESGLIHSLSNSKNNLVGTRNWVPIEGQLQVFLEIVPDVQSIGFIRHVGELNSQIQFDKMRQATESLDIELVDITVQNKEEVTQVLSESLNQVDSLYSACDTLVQGEAESLIVAFAKENQLPSFSCNISGPFEGDLVGTVADLYQIGKMAGNKAILILEGATPISLETDTALRPYIYVNQTTADELGITIPQGILSKAEEIIH